MSFLHFLQPETVLRIVTLNGIYLGIVDSVHDGKVQINPYLEKDLISLLQPWLTSDSSFKPSDYSVPYPTVFDVEDIKQIMILKPCQNKK